MPIIHTEEQKKKMSELPQDSLVTDGDASQATVQVLDLDLTEVIGEKTYTILIRDPLNLKEPVAAILSVFPDGTVQVQEEDLEDIEAAYDTEL